MHREQQQYQAQRAAAVTIQSYARMAADRRRFQLQQAAAIVLQAAFRHHAASAKLQAYSQAASILQQHIRAMQARQQLRQAKKAILTVQAAVRRQQARSSYKRKLQAHQAEVATRELLEQARRYTKRFGAALCIQSMVRGFLSRREFAPTWNKHVQEKRERQAGLVILREYRALQFRRQVKQRLAALAVISEHVPMFRARLQLLQLRRQASEQQRAAVVVQQYARGWLARRQAAAAMQGVIRIQVRCDALTIPATMCLCLARLLHVGSHHCVCMSVRCSQSCHSSSTP
jgi:hypothetical protein